MCRIDPTKDKEKEKKAAATRNLIYGGDGTECAVLWMSRLGLDVSDAMRGGES